MVMALIDNKEIGLTDCLTLLFYKRSSRKQSLSRVSAIKK